MNIPWKRHKPGQPIDREDWNDNVILATNLFNLAQGRQFKRVSPAQIDGIAEKTGCTFTGNLTTKAPVDGVRIADLARMLTLLQKAKKQFVFKTWNFTTTVPSSSWKEKTLDVTHESPGGGPDMSGGSYWMRWYEWEARLQPAPTGYSWDKSIFCADITYDVYLYADKGTYQSDIQFRDLPILTEGVSPYDWDPGSDLTAHGEIDGFCIGRKSFKDASGFVVSLNTLYLKNMVFFLGKYKDGGFGDWSIHDKEEASWIASFPAYMASGWYPQMESNKNDLYEITNATAPLPIGDRWFKLHVTLSAIFWR